MAYPLYVLLPAGVEWSPVGGTMSQAPTPVRWYLRQLMPESVTQVVVLVPDGIDDRDRCSAEVVRAAGELGGIVIDAATQQQVDAIVPPAPTA